MSIYSLVLMVVFFISLFSVLLILAACVASSRSQQIVELHSARFTVDKSFEALSSDLRRNKPMANGNIVASIR
jgi:hypothetical protein